VSWPTLVLLGNLKTAENHGYSSDVDIRVAFSFHNVCVPSHVDQKVCVLFKLRHKSRRRDHVGVTNMWKSPIYGGLCARIFLGGRGVLLELF
jgi:hypothetical protein